MKVHPQALAAAVLVVALGGAINQILGDGNLRHLNWKWLAASVVIALVYEAVAVRLARARRAREPGLSWWRSRTLRRRYLDHLARGLRGGVDVKGLGPAASLAPPPSLSEVFIDIGLTERVPRRASRDRSQERLSLGALLGERYRARLVITGGPGCGKTTLLRQAALERCSPGGNLATEIPILLYLREHVTAITGQHPPGLALIVRDGGALAGMKDPPPVSWLEDRLGAGECLVLLDGLDEVAKAEDRVAVARWVEEQISGYPYNGFVITSRPHGYDDAPVDGAERLYAQDLTDEQVARFLDRWYRSVEGDAGTRRARDLQLRLQGAPQLRALTVNPLLLTMIAIVHREENTLPGSRAELYQSICRALLWKRRSAKSRDPQAAPGTVELTGRNKEEAVQALAFAMMDQGVGRLAKRELHARLESVLSRFHPRMEAGEFVEFLEANGLLVEPEPGVYAFAHHSFQEYLASAHLVVAGWGDALPRRLADPWWRETIVLYTAQTPADDVIDECLKCRTDEGLYLALDCAEQKDASLPSGLRAKIDERIAGGLSVPAERQRTGEMLLARILPHPVRLDGGELYIPPVTWRAYELFLRDTGQHRPPDRPVPGDKDQPVTGVRAEDAAAFAEWVNTLVGPGSGVYRLPTEPEMNSAKGRSLPVPEAVWLDTGDGADARRWHLKGDPSSPGVVVSEELMEVIQRPPLPMMRVIFVAVLARAKVAASVTVSVLSGLPYENDIVLDDRVWSDLKRCLDIIDALDFDPVLGLSHAIELARCLDRVLDTAHDLHRLCENSHFSGPGNARDIACTRARARARGRKPVEFDVGLTPARALALTRGLGRELGLFLRRDDVREVARDLGLDLTRDVVPDLDIVLAVDRDQLMTDIHAALRVVAGGGLAGISEWVVDRTSSPLNFAVVEGLVEMAFPDSGALQRVTLADLPAVLRDACDEIEARFGLERVFVHASVRRLREDALPVLERSAEPSSRDAVISLRLTALLLAIESDFPELGDKFRMLAAGLTVLETRLYGDTAPSEQIILARPA